MKKMAEGERATQDELRELFRGAIRVTLEMVLKEELKALVAARRSRERTPTCIWTRRSSTPAGPGRSRT